jgi:hypothetical protein
MPTDGSKVVYLEAVRSFLLQCSAKASKKNLEHEILDALQKIDEALHRNPLTFGDPWRRLGTLRLFHRLLPPFDVVYGVHTLRPLVFVREMRLFPTDRLD